MVQSTYCPINLKEKKKSSKSSLGDSQNEEIYCKHKIQKQEMGSQNQTAYLNEIRIKKIVLLANG